MTSDQIAFSIGTNAVVVRRILGELSRAGLVHSQVGKAGGTQMARSPEHIDLYEVYRAVDDAGVFAHPERPGNPACPVGRCMHGLLEDVFAHAERAVETALRRQTIGQLVKRVPR